MHQIESSLHWLVELARFHDGTRHVVAIHEVRHVENGQLIFEPLYLYHYDKEKETYVTEIYPERMSPYLQERFHRYEKAGKLWEAFFNE